MIEIVKFIHFRGGPTQKTVYCAQRLLTFKATKLR